jgi:hypothetical protein
MYRDRRTLNLTLLIIVIAIVSVVAIAIISVNAAVNNWGVYEILAAIGGALLIIGGFGVYTNYAGGVTISSTTLAAQAPEVARAEANYARSRRKKMPWISFIIMAVGIVFLAVGLADIF